MARRAEVKDEAIIEAGEALRAAGEAVTGWALRMKLGGGKTTRLLSVWQRHLAELGDADAEAVGDGPQAIPRDAWANLTRDVGRGLGEALRDALVGLDGHVANVFAAREQAHHEALHEALREAEAVIERLEKLMHQAEDRATDAAVRAEVSAAREADMAAQVQRVGAEVSGLRQELADVRTLLQAAQAAEASVRAEADAVRAEIAHATAARDEAVTRAAAAEDRERQALERAARAEGALEALRPRPRGRPPSQKPTEDHPPTAETADNL